MKVFLINQYAGNKGDRAVLFALCNLILKVCPKASISVSTSDPSQWKGYRFYERNNIKFVPSAWDYVNYNGIFGSLLKKFQKYTFTLMRESYLQGINVSRFFSNPIFFKEAKNSDIIIGVGGHHFTTILSRDLVSSINFDATVASCQKAPYVCFSQSFGPFTFYNDRNKILTKKILQSAHLFPREEKSVNELLDLGIDKSRIKLTFESVISLNNLFERNIPIERRKKRIGIAIYATQKREEENQKEYVSSLSEFCDYALSKGFEVVFFPMELKGSGPDDRPMIKSIISKIKDKNKVSIIDKDLETLDHLREVASCQLFVGHKTHSTIFALTTGTPLIGIAYHPKTIEFMRQYGIEEYAIDDKYLNSKILIEKFDNIIPRLSEISDISFNKSREIADIIESDLKEILK